ncbi:MAG: ABC transporter substrate-binding protein [Thermoanaerobaculia bacterium]
MRRSVWWVGVAVLAVGCHTAAKPKESDTLHLAMEEDVIPLDPHLHDDSVTHSVLSNVFDSLVTFDRSMRIVPALATRWENPSDLVWRFHMRKGVVFHDGRPFTAADVKNSLGRASRTKTSHFLSSITRIGVLDGETLEIETRAPEPVLLNKLVKVGIVPTGTPEAPHAAVGTGAYRVVVYKKGSFLEVAASPGFWGGRPAIPRAFFDVVPQPAKRASALARREIQLARDVKPVDLGAATPALPLAHITFLSEPGLNVTFLGVSLRAKGPLQNARVRRAIFWALDPQELLETAWTNACTSSRDRTDRWCSSSSPGVREPYGRARYTQRVNPAQNQKLRHLLEGQRVAALGTLQAGEPFVSMVPFALLPDGTFVIHVSSLASHTGNMLTSPRVSLLVMTADTSDVESQALARVTVQGDAEQVAASHPGFPAARGAYLTRFPQVAESVASHDFSFFAVRPTSARYIGGFAQAFSLSPDALAGALHSA